MSVLHDTNEFEKKPPFFVITNKLRNVAYHVNDIPKHIMTDAPDVYSEPQPTNDIEMSEFQRELVVRELELQSAHPGRMIKTSQARKRLLDALLAGINYIDAARRGGNF